MLQPVALVLGHTTTGEGQKAESDWLSQGGYASCRITFGGSKIGGLTDSTLINSAGQIMGLSNKAEDCVCYLDLDSNLLAGLEN